MSNTAAPQVYFEDIVSVPAAAVLAVFYSVFLAGFIVQWARFRSRVYRILSFFCAIRFTSFILRGVIAGSATVNVGLLIGEEILSSIGLFPLLNAMNQLLFDLETIYVHNLLLNALYTHSNRPMSRILRFHALYRLLILGAVVIGSVGLSQVYTSDDSDTIAAGISLHITSSVLFLVIILYLACQTVILSKTGTRSASHSRSQTNFGARYGTQILMGISVLLFIRELYDTATARDRSRANNEHLWYPLLALPEILAVLLFAIPGLIPARFQRSETVFQEEQEKSPVDTVQSAPACVESQVRLGGISDSPPQLPADLVTSKSDPGLSLM